MDAIGVPLTAMTSLNSDQAITRLGASPDRLDSWKEIACYLKREVRTVQLWEKREGMPVHRHFHNQLSTVFAFRSEIEAWSQQVERRRRTKELQAAQVIGNSIQQAIQPALRRIAIEKIQAGPACKNMQAIVDQVIAKLAVLAPSKLIVIRIEASNSTQATSFYTSDLVGSYRLSWTILSHHADEGLGLEFAATLTEFRTGHSIWTQSFVTTVSRPNWAEPVAEQIVRCVWLKIFSSSQTSIQANDGKRASAREAYLKGRYFQCRRDEAGLHRALDWFHTAIDLDPGSPLAYSGLADSLTLLCCYEFESPSETMPAARLAATRAIELGVDVAEGHASMADIHFHFDLDWARADQQYRSAIECNPGYALAYHWYANLLAARGQHEAARTAILRALDIDPVSAITWVWAGVTSYLAHRFDEAIVRCRSALELDPDLIHAHVYLAQTLEQQHDYDAALQSFERAIQLSGGSSCVRAMKAHALAVCGDCSSARKILREVQKSTKHKCVPSYDIAAAYAALGEWPQSINWLQRACSERHMRLYSLGQDPRFDEFRYRSEFRDVVEGIGLKLYS
jgi:tetratricopeptide (TPR) repeat protein